MIKIDGNKIKKLRESQGLTQLYIATVVEVTTDTISRWENKRYPSIKKENGLKLAEALEVELSDILLIEEKSTENESEIPKEQEKSPTHLSPKVITAAAIVLICILVSVVGLLHYYKDRTVIQAQRIMPASTIPNSPFPIVIEVRSSSSEPISLILKEILPENCTILQKAPLLGSSSTKGEVKWIQKIQGTTRFSYLVKIKGQLGERAAFSGSVAILQGSKKSLVVNGSNTVLLGTFHWADHDGDNRINDQEILNVFDRYSGIDDFKIDIDLIERMWLGSHYTWNREKNLISITQ